MNICSALGHRFQAHPAGYHFCRRCGEFQLVAMSLLNYHRNDPLLRAAEGETGASPPARSPTESPGGGRDSASDTHACQANTKAAPEQSTPAPAREKHAEPVGGGEAASIDAEKVRARLEKYLAIRELTITSAIKEGLDLGASMAVLYNLKNGKHVSDATLANVNGALDRLFIEEETPGGEVGPKIERLPTTLPPITGTNPIPKPTVPARCARTP